MKFDLLNTHSVMGSYFKMKGSQNTLVEDTLIIGMNSNIKVVILFGDQKRNHHIIECL